MTKHAGGRPSKYQDEFINKVDDYIKTTGKENMELPTKQGFALYLDVDVDTINNWANARVKDKEGNDTEQLLHPEFFGALAKLMLKQYVQLVNDGVYGGKEVNATIIKLMLENNHGMVGIQKNIIEGGDKPLELQQKWSPEQEKIIAETMKKTLELVTKK